MISASRRKKRRVPADHSQWPDDVRFRARPKRRTVGATALSVVLHCTLLLAVLTIRFDPVAPIITASIINAELWQIDDGADFDSEDASEDNNSEGPGSTGESESTELPDPDTRRTQTEEVFPEPRTEPSAAARSEPETAVVEEEHADAGFEDAETPVEPAAPPVVADERPPSQSPDPVPEVKQPTESRPDAVAMVERPPAGSPDAVTVVERAERPVSEDGPESPVPVPRRIPVPEAQRRMLDSKLDRWARNFDREAQLQSLESWEHEGLSYTAEYTQLPVEGDMGIERVAIQISTEANGDKLSTEIHMMRLAFSSFAHFIDRWDPNVQMHDDVIDGRFHSNSEITLSSTSTATPQFLGKVTTASRGINTSNSRRRVRRNEVFLGGLETGVARIALPKGFQSMIDEATLGDRAHRFEEDTRITFYADGSYGWTSVDSPGPEQRRPIPPGSAYFVAARKAKLHVKGVVNGAVLVYSPERIIIEGNLIYALNADMTADASDFLGLVSDKSVEIAPPEITGPGDLTINASIYAKRRFVVSRYRSKQDATLVIYGSLATGSVSASEPRFAMKILYDPRLRTVRPPSFPTTDRYETEPWDGEWEIEPLGSLTR